MTLCLVGNGACQDKGRAKYLGAFHVYILPVRSAGPTRSSYGREA